MRFPFFGKWEAICRWHVSIVIVAGAATRARRPAGATVRAGIGCEAGAQQRVGVVRQPDTGTQPIGSDRARVRTILGQQDSQLGQQQRTVAQNLSVLAGVLGCVVDVYWQMTQIGVVLA